MLSSERGVLDCRIVVVVAAVEFLFESWCDERGELNYFNNILIGGIIFTEKNFTPL